LLEIDGRGPFRIIQGKAIKPLAEVCKTPLLTDNDLPAPETAALIDALVPALEREIAYWTEAEDAKAQAAALSEYTHAVFGNGRERMEADLCLLRRIGAALAAVQTRAAGDADQVAPP
jgi:hypothetical protein